MASRKKKYEASGVDSPSLVEMITRFWVTLAIIAAILYGAALMVSRTDGFKGLVRERLVKLAGVPLEVESVRLSAALNLVLEGVTEEAGSNALARIEVAGAVVDWKLIPLLKGSGWPFSYLELEGAALRFTQDQDGSWSPLPAIHRAVYPWAAGKENEPGAEGFSVSEYLRSVRAEIDITGSTLEWFGSESAVRPSAAVSGISLTTQSVRPLGETILWCRLHIDQASQDGTPWLEQFDMEWIRMKDQDVVLRTSMAEPR